MRHKCWQNNVSSFRPNGVSAERAKRRPENSQPRKKSELNPEKICAILPTNYGNGITYLTILGALLNVIQFTLLPNFSHYTHVQTHLLRNHLVYHVSGMDVDGADGHDLLPITRRKLPNQHGDEGVKLAHLLPVVLL